MKWTANHFVLVWRKATLFWRRYARKRFLHFRSQWPWPLTFRPQICFPVVNLVQSYVSTELEVSTAFLFWENRRHELMKTTRNARSHWQHDEAIWTRKCSVNRGISRFILLQSSSVSTRTVAAGRRGKEIDYIVSASQRVTRPIR